MMYLVTPLLATGAAAVELRNLAIDHANDKVEFNGHGFTNGTIVKPSSNVAGLVTEKMYVVDSATTNDFKLKTFKVADATGDAAQALSADPSGAETLTAVGSKKCKIASAATATNKVTCAEATTFAVTDELIFYCDAGTGNDCKVDGNANTKLENGKSVWALEANATSFELAEDSTGTKITIGADNNAAAPNKVWLLSKDSTSIYAVAPKTLIADGGKWDITNDEGVCGNAACAIQNNSFYWYTQGASPTAGLANPMQVVHAQVKTDTPWKFELNTVKTLGGVLAKNTDDKIDITLSGAGGTYQQVANGRQITGSLAAGNTLTITGDNSGNEYAADVLFKFWCMDLNTAGACDYKMAGLTNGVEFKVKVATPNGTDDVKCSMKAATGSITDDIAVSEDTTGKTAGFALTTSSATPTVFPPASAAAGAAGSAARSFAMLGSAAAMATAFLLA